MLLSPGCWRDGEARPAPRKRRLKCAAWPMAGLAAEGLPLVG